VLQEVLAHWNGTNWLYEERLAFKNTVAQH